jgi:aminocarboxymuconate-semialdehyde decarboxylase
MSATRNCPTCHSNRCGPKPPSFYLKKIYVGTIVISPIQLEALMKLFGVDKTLLGGVDKILPATEYPYDMGEYDLIGHIAQVAGLGDADRTAIAGGNARALFGL